MSLLLKPGTVLTCESCNESFALKSYQKTAKYCSKKCAGQAKKTKAHREYFCNFCRDLVSGGPTEIYRGKGDYCSAECRTLHRQVSTMKISACRSCGKTLVLTKRQQYKNKRFCSQKCNGARQTKDAPKTTRACQGCKEKFTFLTCLIKPDRPMNYCSNKCRLKYQHSKSIRRSDGSIVNTSGYAHIYVDGIKYAQHRLIMEQHLNRKLIKGENVHHINGNRSDNRIANLELWNVNQPAGQRVEDKIAYAKQILALYEKED